MIYIEPDNKILRMMLTRFLYNSIKDTWSTFVIDHEGRDYYTEIPDRDRLVTVYILMNRFKRRCYRDQFNVGIAMGMSYKLTPERAMTMSRRKLANMMRIYSLRCRAHFYSRFAIAGMDGREYKWPLEMSHHTPRPFEMDDVEDDCAAALRTAITSWLRENA